MSSANSQNTQPIERCESNSRKKRVCNRRRTQKPPHTHTQTRTHEMLFECTRRLNSCTCHIFLLLENCVCWARRDLSILPSKLHFGFNSSACNEWYFLRCCAWKFEHGLLLRIPASAMYAMSRCCRYYFNITLLSLYRWRTHRMKKNGTCVFEIGAFFSSSCDLQKRSLIPTPFIIIFSHCSIYSFIVQ